MARKTKAHAIAGTRWDSWDVHLPLQIDIVKELARSSKAMTKKELCKKLGKSEEAPIGGLTMLLEKAGIVARVRGKRNQWTYSLTEWGKVAAKDKTYSAIGKAPTSHNTQASEQLQDDKSGTAISAQSDDDADVADDAVVSAIDRSDAKSQGFQLDSKTRKALEDYAMEAAREHFASQGYIVEDYSQNHPYDLLCKKNKKQLHVEVKGTQTKGEAVILTNGEVSFARSHKKAMVLFILHSIQVAADGNLSGGQERVIAPWDVDAGTLKPISFMYGVPS